MSPGSSYALMPIRGSRLNPKTVPEGQGELFAAHRHHAFLTDSPLIITQAEPNHRRHAVIEQVFSDLEDGPLGHLPSGTFQANAAWLSSHGHIFLGCALATQGYAGKIAERTKGSSNEIFEELKANLVPGMILQPNGVYAVLRAQEAGCAFMRST